METLAGDAKMAAGQGCVLRLAVVIHPREPFLRLFGEGGDAGEGDRPGQDEGSGHSMPSIPRLAPIIYPF